jgi:hypothetical protein
MFRLLKRAAIPAVGLLTLAAASPAFAASDNCPDVNAITNFKQSALVSADFSYTTDASSGNTTFTYTFAGLDPIAPSSGGIPGLITYCVFPNNGFLPTGVIVPQAVGANGTPFDAKIAAKGSFSYTRGDGDPSNVPFDGNTYTMGTATWNGNCITDNTQVPPVTVCTPPATDNPTIVLHINDAGECQNLYGGTSSTCWAYPSRTIPPPPSACNGNVACKSADIAEATGEVDGSGYPIVPMFTQLHIKYTYLIVNQPGSGITMSFNPPTNKTQDINSGGGKDYFGCEQ